MTISTDDEDAPVTIGSLLFAGLLAVVFWIALWHVALWIWEGMAQQ